MTRREYFRRFLVPFWLRPESALWYAHEAFLARQYLGEWMRRPSLELACFDATPTFVLLGGEFGSSFDVYSDVTWTRESHRWRSLKDDYYNVVKEADGAPPDVVTWPFERFDVGVSAKSAHLTKAARLKIHDQLVEQDPNGPLPMLSDRQFATIWAPNLYWVEDIGAVLSECRRILGRDGRMVTVMPDASALAFMLYRFVDRADPQWIRDLDRGRFGNVSKNARTLAEWEKVFGRAGLEMTRHDAFVPRIVFHVNDVGLRPLFPVLMNIYETLRHRCPADWLAIKEHWIETVFHFMAPLCDVDWMTRMEMERVWHIFELRPRDP